MTDRSCLLQPRVSWMFLSKVSLAHSRCSCRNTHPRVLSLTSTDMSAVLMKKVAQTSRPKIVPNTRHTAPHTRRCRGGVEGNKFSKMVSCTNYPREKVPKFESPRPGLAHGRHPHRDQDCSTGQEVDGRSIELAGITELR